MDDDEKATTDFRCRRNPGEGFAVSAGEADEAVATGGTKAGKGFHLMRAELSPKGKRGW